MDFARNEKDAVDIDMVAHVAVNSAIMRLRGYLNTLCTLLLCLVAPLNAVALRPLSEEEMDQAHAAGLEIQVVGEETVTLKVESPDLFVNEIFGLNEVITRMVVQIVRTMDFTFKQTNNIDQSRDAEDIAAVVEGRRNVALLVDGTQKDDGFKAVVNRIVGANTVETSINVAVLVPGGHSAKTGGLSNPFATTGGAGPAGGSAVAPSTPAPAPQPTIPQFQYPTSVNGALSLMRNLAQENPQAAQGLQLGISEIEALPK